MGHVRSLDSVIKNVDSECRKRNVDMFRDQVGLNTKFAKLRADVTVDRMDAANKMVDQHHGRNMDQLFKQTSFLLVRLG